MKRARHVLRQDPIKENTKPKTMINFKKYDSENPQIWTQFVHLCNQAKKKGFKTYSAKGVFELIRWHTATSGNDGFKINNNYHADYARKMMNLHPDFKGFFEIRERTAVRQNN